MVFCFVKISTYLGGLGDVSAVDLYVKRAAKVTFSGVVAPVVIIQGIADGVYRVVEHGGSAVGVGEGAFGEGVEEHGGVYPARQFKIFPAAHRQHRQIEVAIVHLQHVLGVTRGEGVALGVAEITVSLSIVLVFAAFFGVHKLAAHRKIVGKGVSERHANLETRHRFPVFQLPACVISFGRPVDFGKIQSRFEPVGHLCVSA